MLQQLFLDVSLFLFLCPLLLEGLFHYIVLHCSILLSTCLSSSLVLEFPLPLSQLLDFLGVKVIQNTVQGSSPHKCGQESCCNAFNAVVAAFSQDISASFIPSMCIGNLPSPLELPGRWTKGKTRPLLPTYARPEEGIPLGSTSLDTYSFYCQLQRFSMISSPRTYC